MVFGTKLVDTGETLWRPSYGLPDQCPADLLGLLRLSTTVYAYTQNGCALWLRAVLDFIRLCCGIAYTDIWWQKKKGHLQTCSLEARPSGGNAHS